MKPDLSKLNAPYREFASGTPCAEIYQKYNINEAQFIAILRVNIKGSYDYHRILAGGIEAQRQFLRHLNARWNPLEPGRVWEDISPYLN
jgi:hypothetical protein